ncbi:MAG: UDP-N-acetylglucosamine--N-acetylmuramyl-(pentapeptide) pyrophosphoryl-undecaprenol N-acetylglucosamine transferase [Puniceicoccales bacterium]|jgi:UDP-N-acetylglucosamine--N-acetylmuramyl-(pentapeptide) pyrophosphoryl-undecaprenol N-acetylglucosamine transferase|nr:UDP-N-acetylglucosamine--N-acetylmuramyl-(pentapeptide) pyrophosphoryl-undecaprenol N-acetylglucosamine transferase [Puniceicoccales bacterium]
MSHFLIACGGTGGHLSPGIALAQELIARGHACILIITQKMVDKKLSQAYPDIAFVHFCGIGWSKKFWLWPKFLFFQLKNFFASIWLLKKFQVDLVLAFGGFISVGIFGAAILLRKLRVLHEANQCPGKAIRFLSHFAKRVYLPQGVHLKKVSVKTVRNFGFPVRKEIQKIDRWNARKQLNLSQDQYVLVVVGGSQGAKVLNKWVIDNFEAFGEQGINVVCVTGVGQGSEREVEQYQADGQKTKLILIPFALNMHVLFSAANLVISRAGAGTIAELTRCETPSILIPYPFATDNHQYANALFFERKGACLMLQQEAMSHNLFNEVIHLIADECLLENMRYNMKQLNGEDATTLIVNDLEQLLVPVEYTA